MTRGYTLKTERRSGATRCLLGAALIAGGVIATDAAALIEPEVGGTVSDVSIRLQPSKHSRLPSPEEIGETDVSLMRKDMTLYAQSDAPKDSVPILLKVKQLRGYRLSTAATDAVQQAVVKRINDMGIGGVAVRLASPDTDESGRATVNVVAGEITEVQAKGIDEEQPTPVSGDAIVRRSPVQTVGDEPALLAVEDVNDYLARLNRFPGRSVTAAISAGENPGTLALDYLVTEEKTFNLYAEVSNTGTDSTNKWLEQFGLFATQLTGNDDILSFEGITSNFSERTRSLNGYYDSRLGDSEDLRWRVTGIWGDYTAADVGFFQQDFKGSTWGVQGDLIWNFYQDGTLFLDLDAGFRYWNSEAQNTFFGFLLADGESDFITPSLSVSAFDMRDTSALQATLGVAYTSPDADQAILDQLGRSNTSQDWWVLFGSGYYSFFLDEFLDPNWADQAIHTSIHELTLRGQGQYAFDSRLTPLSMSTMGGYATVRGYPQATISGDSSIQGSLEYRFHLPRSFDSAPAGRGWLDDDFRWAPDSATGAPPDWDLALLGFIDAAEVWQSDALSFENDATLVGAGIGAELAIRDYMKFTVNYAWALHEVESANVRSGSSRLYFLGSISF